MRACMSTTLLLHFLCTTMRLYIMQWEAVEASECACTTAMSSKRLTTNGRVVRAMQAGTTHATPNGR